MRIITCNVNGLRSAARKGFFDWLKKQDADFVCLQEVKAHESQLLDEIFSPAHHHAYFHDAEKKGYSGVGIYSRHTPDRVIKKIDYALSDTEGRYLQLDFGRLSVVSLYLPSGTSGEARQKLKYEFMDFYENCLHAYQQSGREYILCGDWNIAHKPIDLKNWRNNQKNSGFLPEERAWLDKVFGDLGFVDAFRVVNQSPDQYTWWTQRAKTAWENNVGWRIDYQVITPGLAPHVKQAHIYKEERFSDHAPLIIDYDVSVKSFAGSRT